MIEIYKDGDVRLVRSGKMLQEHLDRGWQLEDVPPPPKDLDLSPFTVSKLRIMAQIANLRIPPVLDREGLEGLLREAWLGLGRPDSWPEILAESKPPIPAEEYQSPAFDSGTDPIALDDLTFPAKQEG